MTEGTQVKFRNGEICTIKEIRELVNHISFNTKGGIVNTTNGTRISFVLEFDDGEITIANKTEFEVI